MNQPQASAQGPERARAPDAMADAYATLTKLEQGIVALEHPLIATSIAVSLKRIANALEQIVSNTSSLNTLNYDNQRLREQMRDDFSKLEQAYRGPQGPRG